MNYIRLSKFLSHALRHEPEKYQLKLDDYGFAPVDDILEVLHRKKAYEDVEENDLFEMMNHINKKRFEIVDHQMRALYGHSFPVKVRYDASIPPEFLYHGTSPKIISIIKEEGLKSMKRQYVHFSTDLQTAYTVGLRKDDHPILLKIKAMEAYRHNIEFYYANDATWLCDALPSEFIDFDNSITDYK